MHDPEKVALADWRAVHAASTDGTFLGRRHAIRVRGAGSIISLSFRSGIVGVPMATASGASKAAIDKRTRSVPLHCAGQGLNVHEARSIRQRSGRRCGSRWWEPARPCGAAEVGTLAGMLASDAAAYMTGAEIGGGGGHRTGSAVTASG